VDNKSLLTDYFFTAKSAKNKMPFSVHGFSLFLHPQKKLDVRCIDSIGRQFPVEMKKA
jgi:uncharacterized protein (UPF0276 family)